ncbi:2-oxoisovalerate dehydrogenase [Candidatus Acetothermia bacterium]|jgi:predicted RNase H-like HicB family nuclease|nr:2-oxoisovalerate dehydrogenase [Candidatus Acetothermia bacterium]MCI2430977.1 2-oxoisovalerate dehydrogenase [Candidatus Acetothermia bacterium]MCI2436346.1 2-oxoisovalerate dehydrogenase [Candidatus Acetothermia bacterium]
MRTIKMIARWSPEGWWARAVGESIYTQGDTLDDLWESIQDAVAVHFDSHPVRVQLVIESHVPQATPVAR